MSELIIYDGEREVGRIDATVTPHLRVMLTNTTKGDRKYDLQINYEYNKFKKEKDKDRPTGCILK